MRFRILSLALLLACAAPAAAQQPPAVPAAQPDGAGVFKTACATCHVAGGTAAPTPEALRAFTPEAIVNALVNGKMAVQGATLSAAEHRAVAQFITGRAPAATTAVAASGPDQSLHHGDADDGPGTRPELDGLGQ